MATGDGFAYNSGQQEAGATSPLWAVATAPAHWLEGFGVRAAVLGVKAIGTLLGLLALYSLFRIAREISASRRVAAVAASLVALEPRFVFSALSGMETMLLVALVLCAASCMLAGRWTAAAAACGLAAVTRPEAALLLPLFYLAFLLRSGRPAAPRPSWIWILPAIPMLVWVLFCLSASGHPLPTAYYVKARPFQLSSADIRAMWEILTQRGYAATALLPVGMAIFAVAALLRDRARALAPLLVLLLFPSAYALGVAGSRSLEPAGYYWARWLDPPAVLFTAALSVGLAIPLVAPFHGKVLAAYGVNADRCRLRILGAFVALLAVFALVAPSFARTFEDARFHLWSDSRAIHLVNVRPGEWIDAHLPRDAVVGVNDAGAIRYFGKRRTLDLMGLNYADLAFGRISKPAVIAQTDWLAVFPRWFRDAGMFQLFDQQASFSIPLEEYTVCNCPGQTTKVIFRKKR